MAETKKELQLKLTVETPDTSKAADAFKRVGEAAKDAGKACLAMANTAFAVANQWFGLGNGYMLPMPTTNAFGSLEAFVYGKYLVPPGAAFCLAGLSGSAAGTAICGVEWHEYPISTQ